MQYQGRAFKYGDDVNTDEIVPARYLNTIDPKELAEHCMEDLDGDFVREVKPGDIIVADKNFGCGSSREHAPIAIKASGISCVIAKTFARIFFRNSINIGLPIFECPEIAEVTEKGDEITVDAVNGIIENVTKNVQATIKPFPESIRQIIDAGGLMQYIKTKIGT